MLLSDINLLPDFGEATGEKDSEIPRRGRVVESVVAIAAAEEASATRAADGLMRLRNNVFGDNGLVAVPGELTAARRI